MNSEHEQLTFYTDETKKRQSGLESKNSQKKPPLNLKSLFLGGEETTLGNPSYKTPDFKPPFDPEFGIPDESDPNTLSPETINETRDNFFQEIINFYEVSLNDRQNSPAAKATKRAKLADYRSLLIINHQEQLLNYLSAEQQAEFDQLAESYFDTNSEPEKKKLRRQARQLIDLAFQLQSQDHANEENHY